MLSITCAISLGLVLNSCGNNQNSNSGTSSEKEGFKIYFMILTWKDLYGKGGKCETGLEVADYFTYNTLVEIFDASTGDLVGDVILKGDKDDPESRICKYEGTTNIPKADNYKFMFANGRSITSKSFVDLKIMASGKEILGDLAYVDEYK